MSGGGAFTPARRLAAAAWISPLLLVATASDARAATLRLPLDAGAPPGVSTTVPIYIDDATGLLGTDISITYDPAVATAASVSTTSLSSSQTLTVNLSPPGQIRISLYGAYPLSGGGTLLQISFTALGGLQCQTDLRFSSVDINEGAIPAFTSDGHFQVQGPPGEVRNLRASLAAPGSTVEVLSWDPDPGAAAYNVYRGTLPNLSDLACFLRGVAGTSASDDGAVSPTRLFVYLVTAVNCNGESTLGFASSGAERTNRAPCP